MQLKIRRIVASIALLSLTLIDATPAIAATAKSSGDCVWNGHAYVCGTQISIHGENGATSSTGTRGKLTSGPTDCQLDGKSVPCSNKYGWFSDTADCQGYVDLSSPQQVVPSGEPQGSGAWYTCTLPCLALGNDDGNSCRDLDGTIFWSTSPPPGVDRYTPAQAAAALAASFTLSPITIGMAPAAKVHTDDAAGTAPYRRTWVGIPVWLWVADPTPLTFGPYAQTATLGGVTVTATASVSSVTWTTSDGQTVSCGAGTAFSESFWAQRPAVDSPNCGFRFQHISTSQPAGTSTVTASSHWTVSWSGGGQAGTIQLVNLTASAQVQVGELQSVNVPVSEAMLEGNR